MLTKIAIANYRSLRDVVIPVGRLNVVTGPNGSGKSSLYRALRLLAATAQGGLISSLAREGGLQSTLWAGPESFSRSVLAGEYPVQGTRRKEPISLRLGFAGEALGYAIDLGLPVRDSGRTQFALDPIIKHECIWGGAALRPSTLLVDRRGPSIRARGEDGEWQTLPQVIADFDSMMTEFADVRSAPEMLAVRKEVRSWRFYDQFRTDAESPIRLPQIGTHTPVLGNDGADLPAALQTIFEIGEPEALDAAIDDAFPGSRLTITNTDGRFEVTMAQHGLLRPLKGAELSDGTLRYLLLVAALSTPRPPALMVLNEPETSLHPDLLAPLARLVARASSHSQVIVVSHAVALVEALAREAGSASVVLEKHFGETRIAGDVEVPAWKWPAR